MGVRTAKQQGKSKITQQSFENYIASSTYGLPLLAKKQFLLEQKSQKDSIFAQIKNANAQLNAQNHLRRISVNQRKITNIREQFNRISTVGQTRSRITSIPNISTENSFNKESRTFSQTLGIQALHTHKMSSSSQTRNNLNVDAANEYFWQPEKSLTLERMNMTSKNNSHNVSNILIRKRVNNFQNEAA